MFSRWRKNKHKIVFCTQRQHKILRASKVQIYLTDLQKRLMSLISLFGSKAVNLGRLIYPSLSPLGSIGAVSNQLRLLLDKGLLCRQYDYAMRCYLWFKMELKNVVIV